MLCVFTGVVVYSTILLNLTGLKKTDTEGFRVAIYIRWKLCFLWKSYSKESLQSIFDPVY